MKTAVPVILSLSLALAVPAFAVTGEKMIGSVSDATHSPKQGGLGIAAVVGGDAISSYDVDNRIKFIMATARLSNTPDVIAHIRPQVLRGLIDEKLQLQEATKNSIVITDSDISSAIDNIEAQRNMPHGKIDQILEQNHVPKETFTSQIKAQLAWNKLLMRKVRPGITIGEDEIKLAGKKMQAQAASVKQELNIAVISLPVDKSSHENEILQAGQRLVKEVRSGASFEEVARQFSSSSASAGGKVEAFWIRPEQLDPHVARALAAARTGMVTDPIRTIDGFTIVKVYGTRAIGDEQKVEDTEVQMKEILLKLKPDATAKEADVLLQIGEDVAKHPGTCQDKGIGGIKDKDLEDFNIDVDLEKVRLSDLPPALRIIAENLKVGDISTPFASDEGIRLYMLCDRKEADSKDIDKQRVANMLLNQKMELEAQKYMRNLRRETFIDIRA